METKLSKLIEESNTFLSLVRQAISNEHVELDAIPDGVLQAFQGAINDAQEEQPTEELDCPERYTNYYKCKKDNIKWNDDWSCMCNDKCPKCNAEIEPYKSIDNFDDIILLVDGYKTPLSEFLETNLEGDAVDYISIEDAKRVIDLRPEQSIKIGMMVEIERVR